MRASGLIKIEHCVSKSQHSWQLGTAHVILGQMVLRSRHVEHSKALVSTSFLLLLVRHLLLVAMHLFLVANLVV